MTTHPMPTSAADDKEGQILRPARALIGWMDLEQAKYTLAGRRMDRANDPAGIERAQRLMAAVARRGQGFDQTGALNEPAENLRDYLSQFAATESVAKYFAEGWSVKIADLSKVIALQPCIFIDHAAERTTSATGEDIQSVARISLPLPEQIDLSMQFDEAQRVWIIPSRNPNLKIVGRFAQRVKPGVHAFGFAVSILPSFIQVASYRGKLVLRDGYHRSLGLLTRGISKVPVLHKEFGQFEELGLGLGMLPTSAYLGSQPPTLADYLNDEVAAEVHLPASQRMILIHGIEITPQG